MSPTRVGVIGAGIAGSTLAIFLKSKGYDPVVCERAESMIDSGIGYGYVYR
jgi:salicylate hydroxylase